MDNRKSHMDSRIRRAAAGLLSLVLAAGLASCGSDGQGQAETVDEAEAASLGVAVRTERIGRRDIATDNTVSGKLEADNTATIMVGASAKCVETYVEAGEEVQKGQSLCRLDLDSTLSSYNAAQISLDAAIQSYNDQKALFDRQIAVAEKNASVAAEQIGVTREQITVSEGQIPVLKEQIAVAEEQISVTSGQIAVSEGQIPLLEQQIALLDPQIALAVKNAEDTRALLAIGAASQLEADNAKNAADQAKYQRESLSFQLDQLKVSLEASRFQLRQMQSGIDQSRFQLRQLEASIHSSRSSLSQLELAKENADLSVQQLRSTRTSTLSQLQAGIENARSGVQQLDGVLADVDENGNVVAPMTGLLATFTAVEGGFTSPGVPVATITGMNQMKVSVSVSEALVPKLRVGDAADVYVGSTRRTYTGEIRSVERSANPQTRLYSVTLSLPEGTDGLVNGYFADVTFHTDRSANAVVVPSQAILTGAEGVEYVYIVVNGNVARYVEITTGLNGTGVTEVLSGLEGGERLVTVGQSYLNDGDIVRVVEEE